MDFDPAKHLIKIKGKDYLEVKWRIVWLRTVHPEASVETEVVRKDAEGITVRAEVSWPILLDGGHVHVVKGSGYAYEPQLRPGRMGQAMENAETSAIGRALATLGFGTQFSPDMDQAEGFVVDSPVSRAPESSQTRQNAPHDERPHEPAVPAQRAESGSPGENANPATDKQLKAIYAITRKLDWDPDHARAELLNITGKEHTKDLSIGEASRFLDYLNAQQTQQPELVAQ